MADDYRTPHPPQGITPGELDARAVIDQVLKEFGLSQLAGWAWHEIIQGASPTQIQVDLYSQPAFKARFPGIFQRQQAGLPPISPTQYIQYEDSAHQLFHNYGVPTAMLSSESLGSMIGQDVSIDELTTRVRDGYSVAATAPPEVRAQFGQWFGAKGDGALAAYFLNPKQALPMLEQELQAAQIGGAASNLGINIGQSRSERIAQMGVSVTSAANALSKLASERNLFNQTVGEANAQHNANALGLGHGNAREQNITLGGTGVEATLGLSAQSQEQVQQLIDQRQAAFRGGGGAASTEAEGYIGIGHAQPF